MNKENELYVVNKNKFQVKKCCASCAFKAFDSRQEELRICTKGEGLVRKSMVCEKWKISRFFEELNGEFDTMVKRPEYIQFVTKERIKEFDDKVPLMKLKSTRKLQMEFEEQYGTRFMKI